MEITNLGTVIAKRQLNLDRIKNIEVRIGVPFASHDFNGDYCCPYQIVGLGNGKIRYAPGLDAVQAITLAVMKIGTDLYTSDEGKAGRITWNGDLDLGFPVPSTIRDMIAGN